MLKYFLRILQKAKNSSRICRAKGCAAVRRAKKIPAGAGEGGRKMEMAQFVEAVVEQLYDFIPNGGKIDFDMRVYPVERNGKQSVETRNLQHAGEQEVRFFVILRKRRA